MSSPSQRPYLGHGVGLRERHYDLALRGELDVDWVEVISENFIGEGGRPRAVLSRLREDRPVVLHGVSLGIGSPGPPPADYVDRLRRLCDFVEPAWVSDHLCWTHLDGRWSHELLPLPRVEAALDRVVENVGRVQDALRRRILLENVSTYLTFVHDAIPEWEFLTAVAQRADCLILLDLNNILVSARNHGFDPQTYLAGVPAARVWQFHLARHSDRGTHCFDDHSGSVPDDVWTLYDDALRRMGPVSSLVEWDEGVPAWEELRAEQRTARARAEAVVGPTSIDLVAGARLGELSRRGSELERVENSDGSSGASGSDRLTALQRRLWSAVMPHGPGPAARPADLTDIAETSRFPARARLSVYADSIRWRFHGALGHDFPVLAWLLGPDDFGRIVDAFLAVGPSRDPDLGRFGAGLPRFLASHPGGLARPALIELARLEWALIGAIDAADPARLEPATDLRELAPDRWPNLVVIAAPGFSLHQLSFDPAILWRAFAEGDLDAGRGALVRAGRRPVVVWRHDFEVYHRAVEPAEAALLDAWCEGLPFAAAMDRAGAAHALEPGSVVNWMKRWLHDGLLAGVFDPMETP